MSVCNKPASAEALLELARSSRRVLVTGPTDVDGDSIGSCLALAYVLERLTDAELVVAGEPGWRYRSLPNVSRCLANADVRGPFGLAVVLDGDRRRLTNAVLPLFEASEHQAVIDHHKSTTGEGYDFAFVDPHTASTAELVLALLEQWSFPLDAELAQLLLTGIAYDTGGFRHTNTSAHTLRLAADLVDAGAKYSAVVVTTACERSPVGVSLTGTAMSRAAFHAGGRLAVGWVSREALEELSATGGDLDFIVDQLLYVRGVEVAILALGRSGLDGPEVKLSLRSRGGADVCEIAHSLHPEGGGHERAAGVVLAGEAKSVVEQVVVPKVIQVLDAAARLG